MSIIIITIILIYIIINLIDNLYNKDKKCETELRSKIIIW